MMTNLLHGAHVANKLFSTIARLRLLLVMFLTLTVTTNAWGATKTITITQTALGLSGSYTSTSKTIDGVTFNWTDLMQNSSNIQARATSGAIWNSSPIPGNIVSVAVTHSGTARSSTMYFGASAKSTTESSTFSGTATTAPKGEYEYFYIKRSSNAAYWTQIVITYEISSTGGDSGGTGDNEEGDGTCNKWVEVDLSDIQSTDDVVIAMEKAGTIWALPNNGGTSTPSAVVINSINLESQSGIADNLKWNISNNNGTLTIYPTGVTNKWLYCNSANDGVRVGTNANKTFTIDASSGYLKHTSTSRYVGVYTTNPDWRCYTSTTSNISDQTLKFYKYVECIAEPTYSVTIDPNIKNGTVTANPKSATAGTEIALTADPEKGYQFSSWTVTKEGGGTVEVTNNIFTMPASDVTVYATFVAIPQLDTPAKLQVTNITCTGATLTWDKVANNNGYTLLVKNTSSSTTFNSSIAKDVTSGSPTLNPGITYTWKVIAKGDGTNYTDSEEADGGSFTTNYKITYNVKGGSWTACADGCVAGGEKFEICSTVPTKTGYNFMGWSTADDSEAEYQAGGTINNVSANTTLYAVWEQKTYTVILSENGTNTTLTPQTSTSYTLPTELKAGSCQDDTKDFVGWTTISNLNSATEPTTYYYAKGEIVTLSADETTFFAVFATATGGGTENVEATLSFANKAQRTSYSTSKQVWEQNGITLTNDKANSTSNVSDYADPARFYKSSEITIEAPGKITQIELNCLSDYVISVTGATTSGTTVTVTLDGTSDTYTIKSLSAQVRLTSLVVTYTTSGGTSYSDYTTSCVALPDPVLSFATEPANPIVFTDAVCGGNSSKQSVTVVGENLRDVVEVNVTGPYKIARTSSTALKDFTTSLTLDKTNAGETVYIISCPPAQSTEATTGTLTFTTEKGNTLTVNLSTPTVKCNTYKLTFNDRGNKTVENYYAGVEVPQPAPPTGVCTEPIHYVFDGWAERTVANGSTEYTKVTFPYTMPGQNKTLYAVYRWSEAGGGDGDYHLVEEALDDWSGDYLIAYSNTIFADGRIGGKDEGIGALGVQVDLSSNISNNTIPVTVGDQYNVTLEAITGGYLMKTKDGQYNYQSSNESGLSSTENKNVASKYPIVVDFVSSSDVKLCITNAETGSLVGPVFHYNTTSSGYFRFYKDGGQKAVYLYKKSSGTNYFTTSPACGPMLEITSGKEIYVTGGNAQAARDLVMAQQKVSYKATRLNTKDGSAGGTAPDVVVADNGITKNGIVTSEVKVTFENTIKEQQADGTYTITGDIVVTYEAEANNLKEDIQVQLAADYNAEAKDNFTVHARSLPSEFVIVAKSGDKWYALNADMSSSKAQPANGQVTLNDPNNPTEATFAPCNAIYTFEAMPQGAADRISVRFIGMENKYLWAASGTNTGIQNNSTDPAADALAYNWKLYTTDNVTYQIGNGQNSRVLGLNSSLNFGMYAPVSGLVNDIRILPIDKLCTYNYAPTNLKVSVLKSTSVTLTWDAVAGATKYQYSTDGNTWTDAGTEPTVTINGLTGATKYIYYVRAYHEHDATKECIDYSEISFTTADCDDVPTDITYTADLNSITVSWTATAPTATIKLYMNEDGTGGGGTYPGATSPYKISGGLQKNTTYYIQIFSDGTCASPIVPVKTEDVKVDVVEWKTDGIIVDINTDETVGVTLENEVSYGSGLGTEATELFFSKYYEASYNVKLVAIYNGTKNIIDLTDYIIKYGKTSWESNYITLKDFGATKGQIQPGEEIILYSYTENNADDKKILDCVHEAFPNGNWVRVTSNNNTGKGTVTFGGDKTLALFKGKNIIDIIGAVDGSTPNNSKANERPAWGDANGWICATGLSIADDSQIGISTNRCLLVRNNTVTSGANAVANNTTDFVTLCSEWKGAHVLDSDVDNGIQESCENFAYVGNFDYSDYYTKYVSMGDEQIFDNTARNDDGTVTVEISDLYKQSCRNIRVKLSDKDGNVLTDREYKVPIMITTTQGTDGQTFLALQENLATVEVDGNGKPTGNKTNLKLEQVREICKTCDVVVRDNATLTKIADDAANDHPQVRNVYVYENSSLIVPNGTNYTINSLSLRRKGDDVASLSVYPGTLKLSESAAAPITLDLRVDAQNWHWFTLPYNCNIKDVTWVDGSPAQYNVDWFLMTYDGESRSKEQSHYENHWKQYFGTTIEAGKGYIVGITGDINNAEHTFELRFPIAKEVLTDENKDKTVDVRAWGVEDNIRPNKKGWNLVGNPYLAYYQRDNVNSFNGLRLGELIGPDSQTGHWTQTGNLPYVVVPVEGGWVSYEQVLVSETDLLPFTAYFVQVGNEGTHTSEQDLKIAFDHTKLQLSATPMPASLIRRAPSEIDEVEEPVIVGVSLTNTKGESDKTSLVIDDQFTDKYEMNADFFKWFGDYYKYYTKPVLYTIGADDDKLAFNAISEELATQPISLGMYAAQTGDYTFTLDRRSDLSKVQEVWLYDATQDVYTNLMQDSYTFHTAKTESAGRFFLSVKMAPKVTTDTENLTSGSIWATTHNKTITINGLLSNSNVWVYDATGKLLHADQTQYFQHSFSVPQTGAYFIRVHNNNEAQTIAVVVE